MNEIQQLKKEFKRHQNVTDAKFEFFKEWSKKLTTGFQELKNENDLFYESIFQIMDRLDEDIKGIKQRLDKANL